MNHQPPPPGQILRPTLGEDASIKCVGLGGVGNPLARHAGVFLASLNVPARLTLIDGDEFEYRNAGRMIFGELGNKARVLADEMRPRLAESQITLTAIESFVTPENIERLLLDDDIILVAVDNHATRKLVSDHVGRLRNACLVSGGNDGVGPDASGRTRRGTFGNVQVYLRHDGVDVTPPLTRFHPEIAQPADKLPGDVSCTELAATVPQILFTNLAVASAMLNTLLLHLSGVLHYSELAFDIADGLMRPLTLLTPGADSIDG